MVNVEAEEVEADGPEEQAIQQLSRVGLVSDEQETLTFHRLVAVFVIAQKPNITNDVQVIEKALITEINPIVSSMLNPLEGVLYIPHIQYIENFNMSKKPFEKVRGQQDAESGDGSSQS